MQGGKVLVIGSLNTDLVVQAPRLPRQGETVLGTSFQRNLGGKGANQAVAAARQGAPTILAGRVGGDFFGQEQLAALQGEGIDTRFVFTDRNRVSGTALITVDAQGDNRIIVVPGANEAVRADDILALRAIMGQCDCLVIQLEIPTETVFLGIRQANSLGLKVILDPAPARNLPEDIYPALSVITPNEQETRFLTGIEVRDLNTARQAARVFLNRGVQAAVITLGSAGVYCLGSEGEFHLPSHPVNVVDTVAAGDTFTGSLAVWLAQGHRLNQAASYANAAAALTVTRRGAQSSIPFRSEVEQFLRQSPLRINIRRGGFS